MREPDVGGNIALCRRQLDLSARALHRILKLARTIANLTGSEEIKSAHLAEALQYGPKVMMNLSLGVGHLEVAGCEKFHGRRAQSTWFHTQSLSSARMINPISSSEA